MALSQDTQAILAKLEELLLPAKGDVVIWDNLNAGTTPSGLLINHGFPWYPVGPSVLGNGRLKVRFWNSVAFHVYGPTNPVASTPTIDLIVLQSDWEQGPYFPVPDPTGNSSGYNGVWAGNANGSAFIASVSKPFCTIEVFQVQNLPSGGAFRVTANPFTPSNRTVATINNTASQNLSEVGSASFSLGQKTSAQSLPVVLASDETGAAAPQLQGTAAGGTAAVGNPVQQGVVDGSGNVHPMQGDTQGNVTPNPMGLNLLDDAVVSEPGARRLPFTASPRGSPFTLSFSVTLTQLADIVSQGTNALFDALSAFAYIENTTDHAISQVQLVAADTIGSTAASNAVTVTQSIAASGEGMVAFNLDPSWLLATVELIVTFVSAPTTGALNGYLIVSRNPSNLGNPLDHSGTIAVGGTAQTLAPANTNRAYLLIQNPTNESGAGNSTNESLWINFGVTAVIGQPSIQIPAGGSYRALRREGFIDTRAVSVIAVTTGHGIIAKEG